MSNKLVIEPINHSGFVAFKAVSNFNYDPQENVIFSLIDEMTVNDIITKDILGSGSFLNFKLLAGQKIKFWYKNEIGKNVIINGVIEYCSKFTQNEDLSIKLDVISVSVN